MTKRALIEYLEMAISDLTDSADNFGDVGAFITCFKDEQEDQFWAAYDVLRFQIATLTTLASRLEQEV